MEEVHVHFRYVLGLIERRKEEDWVAEGRGFIC